MRPFPVRLVLGKHHPINRSRRILELLRKRGVKVDSRQRELIDALCRQVHPRRAVPGVAGCYVYGPPGRGKTALLDAFLTTLDPVTSARFHFHEFFHTINDAAGQDRSGSMGSIFLRGLEQELAGISVLCFDEFHCVEPGDAMFMARLVSFCRERSITLISTSNYSPEKLLEDPYFHHLIEPTIARLRSEFTVFEFDGGVDYRTLAVAGGQATGYRAGGLDLALPAEPDPSLEQSLSIGHDSIGPAYVNGEHLRISFDQLCRTRRNTMDYLELARRFTRWTITGIPSSESMPLDEQRRFANLIDVLYDRDTEVHLHAQDELLGLGDGLQTTERNRLASRLAQLPRRTLIENRKY